MEIGKIYKLNKEYLRVHFTMVGYKYKYILQKLHENTDIACETGQGIRKAIATTINYCLIRQP